MDSYIIRIYRRDAKNPAKIAGQVELVEREVTRCFGGVEELMEILVASKGWKFAEKSTPASQEDSLHSRFALTSAGRKGKKVVQIIKRSKERRRQ